METFKEIRKRHPDKFLVLLNCVEERVSSNSIRIVDAEEARAFETFQDMYRAYKVLRKENRATRFCTPAYIDELVLEQIPSLGVMG